MCNTLRLIAGAALMAAVAVALANVDPVFIDGFGREPDNVAGATAAHNAVRADVGIAPLYWDEALAAAAQDWADQCVDIEAPTGLLDNDVNRSVGFPWYVGENNYGTAGSADVASAVAFWASQAANYDYDTNQCSSACSLYLQVVWASSVRVGCGISSCANLSFGNSVVCKYGPGGVDGGRPY